jgi:archaellum biogenesis ATPase FlaH
MPANDIRLRSPLRLFEKAIGGGLGQGNLGVVLSRPGVGKTAFLVGMSVDALLQGRKVLHISTEESVDKLRAFYDEIFNMMAENLQLENKMQQHLNLERNRHILAYSRKEFTLEKLRTSANFLRDSAHFDPDLLIMDGTPRFEQSEEWEIDGILDLAKEFSSEVWTSSLTHREGQQFDDRGVPEEVARFDDKLSAIVYLDPMHDHVQVRILKDHDNPKPSEINLKLNPRTLLLRWQ